uniref:Uncharacterized protein n=1 Tax=Cebus imitator TaxID=2715852 RepID=A0A2K5P8S3_CEBIM
MRLQAPGTTEQELKDEEMDLFTKYYSEWKGGRKNTNEFYKTIPRFYYRLPAKDEVLLQKLREESRAVFLQRKSRELLDNEELQNLCFSIYYFLPHQPSVCFVICALRMTEFVAPSQQHTAFEPYERRAHAGLVSFT